MLLDVYVVKSWTARSVNGILIWNVEDRLAHVLPCLGIHFTEPCKTSGMMILDFFSCLPFSFPYGNSTWEWSNLNSYLLWNRTVFQQLMFWGQIRKVKCIWLANAIKIPEFLSLMIYLLWITTFLIVFFRKLCSSVGLNMPRSKGFVHCLLYVLQLFYAFLQQNKSCFNKRLNLHFCSFFILEVEFNLKLFAILCCGKNTTECYGISYYFEGLS